MTKEKRLWAWRQAQDAPQHRLGLKLVRHHGRPIADGVDVAKLTAMGDIMRPQVSVPQDRDHRPAGRRARRRYPRCAARTSRRPVDQMDAARGESVGKTRSRGVEFRHGCSGRGCKEQTTPRRRGSSVVTRSSPFTSARAANGLRMSGINPDTPNGSRVPITVCRELQGRRRDLYTTGSTLMRGL